jgi:hypothetical protein
MFEVYYPAPVDLQREARLTQVVSDWGGKLTYREGSAETTPGSVCLTYEFDDQKVAETAAAKLRQQGAHVEGPVTYSS